MSINFCLLLMHVHFFCNWPQISTANIQGMTGIDIHYSVFTRIPEDMGPIPPQPSLLSENNYPL